jgi:hypothetical protein
MSACAAAKNRRKAAIQKRLGPKTGRGSVRKTKVVVVK